MQQQPDRPVDEREASCRSELCKSHDETTDDNCNIVGIEYGNSSQFQREMMEEAQEKKKQAGDNGYVQLDDIVGQPRLSMGEYFRSSTHKGECLYSL